VKTGTDFFALPVVQGAVAKVGERVGQSLKVCGLRNRVRWYGYDLLDCGSGGFAFVRIDNDADRSPEHGVYSLEDAERFVRARENEKVW
jgi:hypothetical protein